MILFLGLWYLGPSINGLVTEGNTKLCCRGFILGLFQNITANKIDSVNTPVYKRLLPVCEAEILRVKVKRIKVFSSFLLISDDFRLKVPKIAKKVIALYLGFLLMLIKTDKLSINITIQS